MTSDTTENLSDTPPAKPGYLTTEFWKSTAVAVVGLLISLGVITPDAQAKYNQWIQVAAIVATALSVGLYSLSRGKTKAAAIEAAASVVIANKHIQLNRDLAGVKQPVSAQDADEELPESQV